MHKKIMIMSHDIVFFVQKNTEWQLEATASFAFPRGRIM